MEQNVHYPHSSVDALYPLVQEFNSDVQILLSFQCFNTLICNPLYSLDKQLDLLSSVDEVETL